MFDILERAVHSVATESGSGGSQSRRATDRIVAQDHQTLRR